MQKRKCILVSAIMTVCMSLLVFAGVTYAAFHEMTTLQDMNPAVATNLELETDLDADGTVSVTFYTTAITSTGNSVWMYDETNSQNTKLNWVQSLDGNGAHGLWAATVEKPRNAAFRYRYYIAETGNSDNWKTLEENNSSAYRNLLFNASAFVQEDRWKIKIQFGVQYDAHNQTVYISGGFNDWAKYDSNYALEWHSGNHWYKSFTFEYKNDPNYYKFKYVTSYNGIGYENGNNRTIDINSYITSGNICGAYNRSEDAWQN